MANLAPIGSVVRIQDTQLVIVGHRMARDGSHISPGYLLVPYPLGFIAASSLTLTPASHIDEVVSVGFVSPEGEDYLREFGAIADESDGMAYDEYADAVQAFRNYLREEAGSHAERDQ